MADFASITEPRDNDRNQSKYLARALSIPTLALVLAVALLNTGLFPPRSVSEIIGGEYLRRGLRLIAIVFGLSCLPGGLIGVGFGSLIAQNIKLSFAVIQTLRFAQWLPFLVWYVLVPLALMPKDQQLGRYFYIWTISIPAVALGASFHFLYTRFVPRCDWKTTISETARLSVLRAFYVSVVSALSVWMQSWISWPQQPVVHFFLFFALVLFLVVVNWIYQPGPGNDFAARENGLDPELRWRNEGSTATTGLVVILFFVICEMLSRVGAVQVSLMEILKAVAVLIAQADTWKNIGVSLTEILFGLMFNSLVTSVLYATISSSNTLFGRVQVRMASLTFIAPAVLLPIWLESLAYKSLNFMLWTPSCVVVFCFYPFIQAFWATPDQPLFSRLFFAVENALPYAFTAMIYGEMMNATAGLGFAMVIAGATSQKEVGLAVFFIVFWLFLLLAIITRRIMTKLVAYGQNQEFSTISNTA